VVRTRRQIAWTTVGQPARNRRNGSVVALANASPCLLARLDRADCPFLSNCVGRRNYRMFLVFINATTLQGLLMLGLFIGHFVAVAVDTGFASTVGSTVRYE